MSELQNIAKGALGESILRNAGKIKEERGIALWKNLERFYKRQVEDLEYKVDSLNDSRTALLDMSPTTTTSLIAAKDVDPQEFYRADFELTMQIRTARVELAEAKARYEQLFVNKTVEAPTVTAE